MRRGAPLSGSAAPSEWAKDNDATAETSSTMPSAPAPASAPNTTSSSNNSKTSLNGSTVPGHPRRRESSSSSRRKPLVMPKKPKQKKKQASFLRRFYVKWIQGASSATSLGVAVLLWYLLGVVSISTSKLLLMDSSSSSKQHSYYASLTRRVGNVPPLYLTLQQLLVGVCLLRLLLHLRAFGTAGLAPWPSSSSTNDNHNKILRRSSSSSSSFGHRSSSDQKSPRTELVLTGLFFAAGFLATNVCFEHSSAAFVETIKAAEPITSATLAVLWGIEWLGPPEIASLLAIVLGSLLSTVGKGSDNSSSNSNTLKDSFQSFSLIMASNLCFSLRGLHQKLFRALPQGTAQVVDDINLQFRMQQIGVVALILPVLIWDMPGLLVHIWTLSRTTGLIRSGVLVRYVQLSLVNGLAFASYNLASTYILSRISVVHHAALNCIRRMFAIVVTSIAFGVPITWMGALGILVSFGGFLSFTHHKAKRLRQPRPRTSLLPVNGPTTTKHTMSS